MTIRRWRRRLQPLLLTGLFSCWLLLGVLGYLWLDIAERQAAQQSLARQLYHQSQALRQQLASLQDGAAGLLGTLEAARQQDRDQFQASLMQFRRQQPLVGQLALLASGADGGRSLSVQTFTPLQQGWRLLPGQDLARLPEVAAALPGLQRGEAQLQPWPHQALPAWLLLVPGQHGMVLALWLQPPLPAPSLADPYGMRLALWQQPLPSVPQASLSLATVVHQGAFHLQLTASQPWRWQDKLGWRFLVLGIFMLLLWLLGWHAWRQGRRMLINIEQGHGLQQQWLAEVERLAPVSTNMALATLERQLPTLPEGACLKVWWVHGHQPRRRHQLATRMMRLERQLLRQPYPGLALLRLRHGGMLLSLVTSAAEAEHQAASVSGWLAAAAGEPLAGEALWWRCFELHDDVQALEAAMTEPRLLSADIALPSARSAA